MSEIQSDPNQNFVVEATTRHMLEMATDASRIMGEMHEAFKQLPDGDRRPNDISDTVKFFERMLDILKNDPNSIMAITFGMIQVSPDNTMPKMHASITGDPSITFMVGNAVMQTAIDRLKAKIKLLIEEQTSTHH